jgi:hypothetical protein
VRTVHREYAYTALALLILMLAGCGGSSPNTAENPGQSEAIRTYMKDNFGYPGSETSWYGSMTGISVRGNTVVINSTLSAPDARAQGLCSGASGYVFSNQNRSLGIENVQILGANGAILIDRRGVTGRCA